MKTKCKVTPNVIRIKGARQHNLKNLDLDIPLKAITAVTGVSGSGKSSLAFDTLYAEGQRRYVETFSPYARQFMERMDRPHVDRIDNIPPAIAIDRKEPVRTSRSTVGTMTELTDYVKILYARLGQLYCQHCGKPVVPESPEYVWKRIDAYPEASELVITFPSSANGASMEEWEKDLGRMGYGRLFVEGEIRPVTGSLEGHLDGEVQVVADRTILKRSDRKRIIDSLEQAFRFGEGRLDLWIRPESPIKRKNQPFHHLAFSSRLECAKCKTVYRPPLPHLFSFNSPLGACDTCRGFGRTMDIDRDLVVPDPTLSLDQGAIRPWGGRKEKRGEYDDLTAFCRRKNIPMGVPFKSLTKAQQEAIFKGDRSYYGIQGFFKWLEGRTYKMHVRVYLSRYRSTFVCPDCKGTRFKKEALLYRLRNLHIGQCYALSVSEAAQFFKTLDVPAEDKAGHLVLEEVQSRLRYLMEVGLSYLTLDRQSRTLSGGEVQRVALTSALGSSLVNTLYILDEPSIGLHPRDNHRLIRILKGLRDLKNTVVVVEHDPEIISHSDFMLDLGPGAGDKGGNIAYFGPTARAGSSLTGEYLQGKRSLPVPEKRRIARKGRWLIVKNASEHNLKDIDFKVPLGLFVCLTGVSGSGKSTLAEEILYKGIKRIKGDSQGRPGRHAAIAGVENIDDVILVDQRPIGRTPRSNPLTYIQAMDPLRRLLAATDEAQTRHLEPRHFSFNVAGGRCETCQGAGYEKVEMQFLSDVFITCPDCSGRRFKNEILEIRYRGKNIDDILSMTVDEAMCFFVDQKALKGALEPLVDVGLGYMRLGQPMNTLSGGEAQRLKLSQFLKIDRGQTCLFIFDEPTTGLHFEDVKKLLSAFHGLADRGHTVLVIEHNMDVVKGADWVVDLGPEGGDKGGYIVAAGAPQKVAEKKYSHTGRFLKEYLGHAGRLRQVKPISGAVHKVSTKKASAMNVTGAREHNLQNLNLSVPRNQLVAVTGVSGSGKSTLVFDILFAEGQRRYLESLAPYVRQYVRVLERPDVDAVSGLSPTVAIQQRISHASPRSTVATLTEIYHFLRLLYSKLGSQHCLGCDRKLTAQSPDKIIDQIRDRYGSGKAVVLSPKIVGRKGFHKDLLAKAFRGGFKEARIDGAVTTLSEDMALSRYHEHTIDLVIGQLPEKDLKSLVDRALDEGAGSLIVLDRKGNEDIFSLKGICPVCGMGLQALDPRLFSFNSKQGACSRCDGLGRIEDPEGHKSKMCPQCGGSRLKPEALSVKLQGYSIWDLIQRPANHLYDILKAFSFAPKDTPIADPVMAEILVRLAFLNRLGLSYLALSRSGDTLSGGEAQRIRLAAQLGSNLTGVCYILDEPTIGLHPRDTKLLLDALRELKSRGNSVVVVEHDEETIREADHLIDLGPGAGNEGGHLVAYGSLDDLRKNPKSVTGATFNGNPHRITSRLRTYKKRPKVRVQGAAEHNLKNITASFPLGSFICITGVSGSGKSTLLKETLLKGIRNRLLGTKDVAGVCKNIYGWESLDRILEVDHSPIGRTPRSVPATYIGFMNDIRKLFAGTPKARARGFSPGRFSFNITGGRCEACKGHGSLKVEMSFLPHIFVHCEVCNGRRFNQETLDVTYKGKNIYEVLELTFKEGVSFFGAIPHIRRAAEMVCNIGLGYLRLGQPSPTLSGGEAQRIKLAEQLAKPSRGRTFYVLDEPTTGLHLADVTRLIDVLQDLVDRGNTVAVIEHNLELIKEADYILDLGPEGGQGGGRVVTAGSPIEILARPHGSHTARHLEKYLDE